MTVPSSIEPKGAASPYPGLRPFRDSETEIFFGREEQTDQLLEKLQSAHFIAVVGPSGCGKSSLVRAGLIAALETGFLSDAGAAWRVAEMRPGDQPLSRLADALVAPSALGPELGHEASDTALVRAMLRRGPLGLIEIVREACLPANQNLLLLVDQFEEIFRFREQGSTDDADAFVALLLASSAQREVPIYVVITMRSDFLGDCALFTGLPEAINDSQYLTPRLSREQIRAAIAGPARVFGGDVEPALVNRLLNEIGPEPDHLPLLQHALMRMWTHAQGRDGADPSQPGEAGQAPGASRLWITVEDYAAVGQLSEALSKHANEVFFSLSAAQQKVAQALFRRLTERTTGRRDIRRLARLDDIAAVAGVSWADVAKVVEEFRQSGRSFVMPPPEIPLSEATVLDIGHECLIRQWDQLNNWVDLEANSASAYRRLKDTAALWKRERAGLWGTPDREQALEWKQKEMPTQEWALRYGAGEEFDLAMSFLEASDVEWTRQQKIKRDARNARRLWVAVPALTIAVLVLSITTITAYRQSTRANEQAEIANEQAEIANEQTAFAKKQMKIANEQTEIAKEQKQIADEQKRLAEEQRQIAVLERGLAIEESRAARSGEVAARSNTALAVDPELSLLLAMEAARIAPTQQSLHALRQAVSESRIKKLLPAGGDIHSAAYSPDGRLVAAASDDRTVHIWDAGTGNLIRQLAGHTAPVHLLVFSPDGRWIASEAADQTGKVWDLNSGAEVFTLEGLTGKYAALAFSPDGTRIVAERGDQEAFVWDVEMKHELFPVAHGGVIRTVAFSPDGKMLVTAGDDATAKVWDGFKRADPIAILRADASVVAAAFSPDGKWLVLASLDNTAQIYATDKWEQTSARILSHRRPVYDVRVSPKSDRIVTASEDGIARIWTLQGRLLRELVGHDGPVTSAAFSPDGQFVVTASGLDQGARYAERRDRVRGDNTARVWNVQTGRQVALLRGHQGPVTSTAFSPDGRYVLTGAWDRSARIWAAGGQNGVDLGPRTVVDPQFSADGKLVIAAGAENSAVIRDASTGNLLRELPRHPSPVARVALAADGRALTVDRRGNARVWEWNSGKLLLENSAVHDGALLVTASSGKDGVVRVWNRAGLVATWPQKGATITSAALSPNKTRVLIVHDGKAALWDYVSNDTTDLPGHTGAIYAASFNRAGNLVVTASADKTARLWDTSSGKERAVLEGHTDEVNRAVFSPKGDLIATSGDDNTARIWKWPKGRPLILRGHNGPVYDVIFSPDGRYLLTASRDGSARIWDAATGESIETFSPGIVPDLFKDSVAFSPEGSRIMIVSADAGIKLYRCELCGSVGDLIALAKTRVTRGLTPEERERYLPRPVTR